MSFEYELQLTLKLVEDVPGGIRIEFSLPFQRFIPISVFYPHAFHRFIPISVFYPHFCILFLFQCFIPISAFYSHFSVLSPFQRFIAISVFYPISAFYPHFSFRFQFPFPLKKNKTSPVRWFLLRHVCIIFNSNQPIVI